jgi:hypothetical protein
MSKNHTTSDKKSPLLLLFLYLFFSFFTGLIFSVFALRGKNRGKTYGWWWILGLLSVLFFGFIAYIFLATSSLKVDIFYFYLGLATLVSNGLAFIILLYTLLKSKKTYGIT